ncbi:MAG: hypothetical protein HY815_29385 [Candidatus Riflebacteria bacterium]|nr:hypothetical protein [Candidatus Riflebacteria bacterium]
MRFVVTGEWTRNRLLTTIIWLFLVYTAFLWVTNALLFFAKMSLSYQSVVQYYLGDEQTFRQPRTYQGLLEVAHFHMFAIGMLLMTLSHLLLFVPLDATLRSWLVGLAFFGALTSEVAGWLVRFAHPVFAYLKIGAFLTLEASLAALVLGSAWALLTRAPSAYGAESHCSGADTTTVSPEGDAEGCVGGKMSEAKAPPSRTIPPGSAAERATRTSAGV